MTMIPYLTLVALIGAACAINNVRHARDPRSPERPRRARFYRLLFVAFSGVVVWTCALILKQSYDMTAGRWVVYCLTFVAAMVAGVRSCVNDAAIAPARQQRYRTIPFERLGVVLLVLPLLALANGCTGGANVITADPAYKQANAARYKTMRPWLDDYATLRPALAPRVADTADAWRIEVTAQQQNTPAPATQPAR